MNAGCQDKKTALFLLLAFFWFYLFTAPADLVRGDGGEMLFISHSFFEKGFQVASNVRDDGGEFCFGIGQSLLDLSVSWMFGYWEKATGVGEKIFSLLFISSLGALIGALVNVLFFLICREAGFSPRISLFGACVNGFATAVWPYSQTLLAEPTICLLWLISLWSLMVFQKTSRSGYVLLAGSALGFSFLTKVVSVFAILVFSFYFLFLIWYQGSWKNKGALSLLFFIPILAGVGGYMEYNFLRFGDPLNFGYKQFNTRQFGFSLPVIVGLYSLLLSSGKGLFFYNPVLILSLFGLPKALRGYSGSKMCSAGVIAPMILFYSCWYAWNGDWAWGPRHIIPLLPFLLFLGMDIFAEILNSWHESWIQKGKCCVVIILVLISIFVQFLGVAIDSNDYIGMLINLPFFQGAWYDKEKCPIRDDLLLLHYVPEFSPLWGHWWMLRCNANSFSPPPVFQEIAQNPPWASLNKKWVFPNWSPQFRFNIWWVNAIVLMQGPSGWVISTALFFAAMALLFFLCAFVQTKNKHHLTLRVGPAK